MTRGKSTRGCQKITMKKMENESNLQVTFSKRRSSLFKKANELCILTGAEVGIIVFSPGKKVFSFGHPTVEIITKKFSNGNVNQSNGTQKLIQAQRDANIREMNVKLNYLQNLLEFEKERGEALNEMRAISQSQRWWEASLEDLNLQQLEHVLATMKELKSDMKKESDRRSLARHSFYGEGGGSSCTGGSTSAIMPFPVEDNYFGHKAMSSLVEPTYIGSGSSNTTFPSLARPSSFGGAKGTTSGDGGLLRFPLGPTAYGVGGSGDRNVNSWQYSIGSSPYGVSSRLDMRAISQSQRWWEASLEDLNRQQLEHVLATM